MQLVFYQGDQKNHHTHRNFSVNFFFRKPHWIQLDLEVTNLRKFKKANQEMRKQI